MELTKRHRESLEVLRKECAYEDSRVGGDQNFILWHQVTGSHGEKTRAELIEAGFAIAGQPLSDTASRTWAAPLWPCLNR